MSKNGFRWRKRGEKVSIRKYYIKIIEVEQPWGDEIRADVYDDESAEIIGICSTVDEILKKPNEEIFEAMKKKVEVFDQIHSPITRNDLIKDIMLDVLMLLIKLLKKDNLDKVEEEDITDELLAREDGTDSQKS